MPWAEKTEAELRIERVQALAHELIDMPLEEFRKDMEEKDAN